MAGCQACDYPICAKRLNQMANCSNNIFPVGMKIETVAASIEEGGTIRLLDPGM